MTNKLSIDIIVNNDELSVAEKIKKLDELKEEYILTIELVKKELTSDFRFCHICSQYYKKKFWEEKYRPVIKFKNGTSIKNEKERYLECPAGHKYVDFYDC